MLQDYAEVALKDITLYVGDDWNIKDNFVDPFDKDGLSLLLENIKVTGDVDTTKTGNYELRYSLKYGITRKSKVKFLKVKND